jgi:hypothetical protein
MEIKKKKKTFANPSDVRCPMKQLGRSHDPRPEDPTNDGFKFKRLILKQPDASDTERQPSFGQSRIWTQTLHIQKFWIDISNIRIPLQHEFFKLLLPMVIWKLGKQP